MPEPPELDVSMQVDGAEATIAVAGEFDLNACPAFLATLNQVLDGRVDVVTIDASKLGFADSSAVVTLLRAREAADAQNVEFRLARRSEALQRVLSLAGLDEVFEILDA